jgi:hypothetical protein
MGQELFADIEDIIGQDIISINSSDHIIIFNCANFKFVMYHENCYYKTDIDLNYFVGAQIELAEMTFCPSEKQQDGTFNYATYKLAAYNKLIYITWYGDKHSLLDDPVSLIKIYDRKLTHRERYDNKCKKKRRLEIALVIRYINDNMDEIKKLFNNCWTVVGRRSGHRIKELALCLDQDADEFVFPGDWILLTKEDRVIILTDFFYNKRKERGDFVL